MEKCYTCTNCTCLMHSCNYVVFEKFTCAYLTPNCIEKLLPEQDSFKMLYGLHAAAWISIAKISFCGLWTISDNEYKFQGNFHWLFEAFSYKFSLNILLHLSPPQYVTMYMYFACFPKTAEDSFFLRQSWPQWLFQWIYLVIIAFFVSTDHQRHAMSTHPLYLFPQDPCQVNLFLSPSSYLYHHGNWPK